MTLKIKFSTLIIALVFLLLVVGAIFVFPKLNKEGGFSLSPASLIQPVEAQEIYPMFLCPCCGEPLDKNNICCEMAEERIKYIDSLIGQGAAKDEIVLAYAKKYGLNSFADKELQKQFKEKLIASAPADRPIISLKPENYDFGQVSQKKGVVSTFFELKNNGKSDLILNNLSSSCGCTSASIVYQGKESPRFAMEGHGITNPKNWKLILPAGETAQLKVYYDPDVHADFRGYAIREITVFSNDPIDFEKKVQVELTQVD